MKKIILILIIAIFFVACEKVGTDNTPTHNQICKDVYENNYNVVYTLYVDSIIDSVTFNKIIEQYEKDYNECINNN